MAHQCSSIFFLHSIATVQVNFPDNDMMLQNCCLSCITPQPPPFSCFLHLEHYIAIAIYKLNICRPAIPVFNKVQLYILQLLAIIVNQVQLLLEGLSTIGRMQPAYSLGQFMGFAHTVCRRKISCIDADFTVLYQYAWQWTNILSHLNSQLAI